MMVPHPVRAASPVSTQSDNEIKITVRPFLKWAGGKRQLLPHLRQFIPPSFGRYVEPFLGSAALFLDLYARDVIGSRPVLLGDTNADLIGTYGAVAHHVNPVIRALRMLAAGHALGGA